jgi:hypothetical protein
VSYREDRQKSKKKEETKGKRKEGIARIAYIYILTTQHFERELRKYLPVENRFCTMFEEALRRFPSNNFLEAVKRNFFWR